MLAFNYRDVDIIVIPIKPGNEVTPIPLHAPAVIPVSLPLLQPTDYGIQLTDDQLNKIINTEEGTIFTLLDDQVFAIIQNILHG